LKALRQLLKRDRRDGDRRVEGLDRRIFPRERRVGERRSPPRGAAAAAGGDGTRRDEQGAEHLPDLGDIIIELQEADLEMVEQTMVKGQGSVRG
jgi:hypothetical protein